MRLVEVGPRSFPYIQERLTWGMALGKRLAEWPADEGQVITFLPDEVDPDNVDFESGFFAGQTPPGTIWESVDHEASDEALVDFLLPLLLATANSMMIFDDGNRDRRDFLDANPDASLWLLGDAVLHFTTPEPDALELRLAECLQESRSWYVLGALVSWPGVPKSGAELSESEVDALVSGIQLLVIGAYDGEGYLVWQR